VPTVKECSEDAHYGVQPDSGTTDTHTCDLVALETARKLRWNAWVVYLYGYSIRITYISISYYFSLAIIVTLEELSK